MLRRRPRSPLSLETVSPQAFDLDTDGIIGSDDELDDAARASQRQRIEKLADSCRRGQPLCILSASLRGPFDKGWVNPWRKNRKRKANSACNPDELHEVGEKPEGLVVQETDPRKRRFRESSRSHRPPTSPLPRPDTVHASPVYNTEPPASRDHHRFPTPREDERSRSSRTRLKRPRTIPGEESLTQVSSPVHPQSNDGWLKKDRSFPHLNYIDPPSSPTRAFSSRYLGTKPRKRKLIEDPSIRRISSPKFRETTLSIPKETGHFSADRSCPARQSEFLTMNDTPDTAPSPYIEQHTSHPGFSAGSRGSINPETSLIVTSSSHLPKFEYRRRKKSDSSRKRRSKSSSAAKEENPRDGRSPANKSAHVANDSHPGSSDGINPRETASVAGDHNRTEGNRQRSVDGEMPGFCPAKSKTNLSTGEDTIEKLPSAQQVPKSPSVTDCETSLHSTAVPKVNSERGRESSPEVHFSTQAAVLHAQKSFQNDLDTPDQIHTTSKRKRRSSQFPPTSQSHPGSITPFYRLGTPGRNANDQSAGVGVSTQYMIDAVTPFTVSTGRSSGHTDTPTKSKSGNRRPKTASFAISSSQNGSRLPENGTLPECVAAEAGTNLDDMAHQAKNYQPDSQLTALPLTLTGSTPPTAQDIQGVDSTDSFNLNQAIADAGSWLQQSFDFNHELKQCSKTAPSSSDARRSAMSLDTVS